MRAIVLLGLGGALAACGGASAVAASTAYQPPANDTAAAASTEQERYAQAEQAGAEETRSDGNAIPLLIYTAEIGMAVHAVSEKEDQVEAIARQGGGFLASRTDDTIVVRIPAREFQHALGLIEELGDVLTRRVEVQDVTEDFNDIQTRIQTLEAMRQRVEQLLHDAHDVAAALAIEQHLERITVELEHLRGRLRFLSNRVAFSTITVRFQERAVASEPTFELPFHWLHQLGLQRLIQL